MEQKENKRTTTIVVTMEVRNHIDKKGKRNETFDKILRRLLEIK
ncbi:MAG: hypothetical protein U9Q73_00500 [Nanoarchaeota archaeon]|nr:hypothetical protein [Nanoarchaeota archaeon]